jgi:hypothetical protein
VLGKEGANEVVGNVLVCATAAGAGAGEGGAMDPARVRVVRRSGVDVVVAVFLVRTAREFRVVDRRDVARAMRSLTGLQM